MEIVSKRTWFTEKSTISEVSIDGKHECFILEDKDRGLDDSMTLEEINKLKKFGITAIPYGRYKVIVTKSERFSKAAGHDVYLPLLLKVKGFEGVRFHSGNKPEDTEGCQLPGTTRAVDFVGNSRTAFIQLNDKINQALKKGEDVYFNVVK
jgi:hypothetical protein